MVTSSTPPLFPQIEELSVEEKYNIIARFIPCDVCPPCNGFHPYDKQCHCGHDTLHHIDGGQDLDRRLKVALRLNELLEEKGKLDDYSFEDQDIISLKKQILYNAANDTTVNSPDLKRNRDAMHADHDEENRIQSNKRTRVEEQSDKEDEDEDMEEEDDDEEEAEQEQEEEEEDEDDDEEEDEEQEEDEQEEEEHDEQVEDNEDVKEIYTQQPIEDDIDTKNDVTIHENNTTTLFNENNPQADTVNEEKVESIMEDAVSLDGQVQSEDEVQRMIAEFMPKRKRESAAMREEREGDIKVQVVVNDGSRENMILLTGLKNIFQKQLPKMPKEYIARLVYDRNHRSIALLRDRNKVIGGICFRPFEPQEFAEIVFCAIASSDQEKGYGSFIMNHLKDYVSGHTSMKHFLTYADSYAVGYFKKQGFTVDVSLEKRKWVGFIKDYEGATIMQCTMVPRFKYLQVRDILGIQQNAIMKKVEERSTNQNVYPGVVMPVVGENGNRAIEPHKVPGISESGWTPEMDALSNRPRHSPYYHQMLMLVEEMQNYTHAWPFLEPVNIEEVADYYDIIRDPMDLATLEENVKADAYPTMEDFVHDTQKIFDNCKIYNGEDTEYARCSQKLERFFNEKLRSLGK